MNKLLRLYHTVKYLKACQVTGQIRNRLRSRFENPARLLSQTVPDFVGCCWPLEISILPPGMQGNRATDILTGSFSFLNNTCDIGWMPDWQCKDMPKLWQYNLHYFEWLWALDYEDAKAVTLDWIVKHPLKKGQVGWEPYPISLRLMNLCGVFFAKFRKQTHADIKFSHKLWQSIYYQCQWLVDHLEVHLLGNHYFENAAALAFVGSCFQCPVAQQWLDIGLAILQKEIPEQILPDGMHFELSPMYHSRILYLLAILSGTRNKQLVDLVKEPLNRMTTALRNLCHPDGQIALLNDSAFGIYNQPKQLFDYCSKVSGTRQDGEIFGAYSLPDAGYYGWRDEKGNYLICDAGRIGPDYIPGHAHADIFNFELSLNGHRVIVDAGVYDYVESDMRRYCRSTAAHNTVEIDNQDQCECWGAFRVAKRGYPRDIKFHPNEDGFQLSGSHSGYEKLSGKPVHHRNFNWNNSGCLTITDKVATSRSVKAVCRLHLHPDCKIESVQDNIVMVNYPVGIFWIECDPGCQFSIEDSLFFSEFEKKYEIKCLEFMIERQKLNINTKIVFDK
ncbi:MAG: alginate lyase family protein [Anaerohalosphaera sp.]|nr:alginate lyase family protein [Anaerohalosphaera sp.]